MHRARLAKILWFVTAAWVLVLLLSLHTGWLNRFFFDTSRAQVQGIDYFPVPRAALNLLDGRSAYDTFHSSFGPRATWFLYHPAAAVGLGTPLMAFSPWTGYWFWTAVSVTLMAFAAWLLMQRASDPVRKPIVMLLMLGAFPTFIMLYVGNMQALLVLALTLIFVALDKVQVDATRSSQRMLMAGLLLSLFTKPVALVMLPLLLLIKATRRTAAWTMMIYGAVSFLCLVIPGLNPEPISWTERLHLLLAPATVQQTMNIYVNRLDVTAPMKDNSVHWFTMVALSNFRLPNVDVFSLPVFVESWLGRSTPDSLYRVPSIVVAELTVLVAIMRSEADRLRAAASTLMAASLLVFLSYGVAWEYSYTGILPITGYLLMQRRQTWIEKAMIALGAIIWAPSLYFLVSAKDTDLPRIANLIRLDRVLPALLMFCLLSVDAMIRALRSPDGLRGLGVSPTARGFDEPASS